LEQRPATGGGTSPGNINVDGEPFFPIGIYSVPPTGLAHARALGFNLVHTYGGEGAANKAGSAKSVELLQDYLRAADTAGVKVMLGLPRHAVVNADYDELHRRVEALRPFRALAVWYLYDEPDIEKVPASALNAVARIIDGLDGTRLKAVVVAGSPSRAAEQGYLGVANITMVDPYPYVREGADVSVVYRTVADAVRVTRGNKPVWAVVQAHGRGPGGSGRGYGRLEPPYPELRNMAFQAIAAGARGILFFTYKGSAFDLTRTPQGLANIRRVVAELRDLVPMLLSPPPAEPLIRFLSMPGLISRSFLYDGAVWLLLVNSERREMGFSAQLRTDIMPTEISVPAEGRLLNSLNGRLEETLGPLDVRLYRIPVETSAHDGAPPLQDGMIRQDGSATPLLDQ
jgi:hypothetical protein